MFTFHEPEKLIQDLNEFSIIVEGKRDKEALEKLGIRDIFVISGKSIDNFIDTLPKDRKYIVLTDFDKEGERKMKKIHDLLLKNKFVLNKKLRLSVKNLFRIVKIEELRKISKFKEDVYHGKISTIDYKILNRSRIHRKWCSREARRNWSYFWSN